MTVLDRRSTGTGGLRRRGAIGRAHRFDGGLKSDARSGPTAERRDGHGAAAVDVTPSAAGAAPHSVAMEFPADGVATNAPRVRTDTRRDESRRGRRFQRRRIGRGTRGVDRRPTLAVQRPPSLWRQFGHRRRSSGGSGDGRLFNGGWATAIGSAGGSATGAASTGLGRPSSAQRRCGAPSAQAAVRRPASTQAEVRRPASAQRGSAPAPPPAAIRRPPWLSAVRQPASAPAAVGRPASIASADQRPWQPGDPQLARSPPWAYPPLRNLSDQTLIHGPAPASSTAEMTESFTSLERVRDVVGFRSALATVSATRLTKPRAGGLTDSAGDRDSPDRGRRPPVVRRRSSTLGAGSSAQVRRRWGA